MSETKAEEINTDTAGEDDGAGHSRFQKEVETVSTASSSSISNQVSEYDSNQFLVENFSFESSSTRSTTPERYFCRICHQRNLPEPNISPCSCRGTMGLVHKSCLELWLAASDSNKCELCGFQYSIHRHPKYTLLKAVKVWLTLEEFRRERLVIVSDSIGFLTAFPMLLLANHETMAIINLFQLEDEGELSEITMSFLQPTLALHEVMDAFGRLLTFFVVGAVSMLDVFYFGWMLMRLQSHCSEWYKWYRTQCVVHLILPDRNENTK